VISRVRFVAAVLVAVAACLVPAATVPADVPADMPADMTAGDTSGTAPSSTEAPEPPGIIPKPNSGAEPDDAGDRGGGLQSAVFGLIVLGLVGMGALVVRESRRAQSRKRSQEP
jgi:hypothetical protein